LIKSTTALLADQIRREDNGKGLIVGVYTGDVLVSSLPASMSFAVWLELEISGADLTPELDLEIRLKVTGENKPDDFETRQQVQITFQPSSETEKRIAKKAKTVLVINGVPAQIRQGGQLDVSIRTNNGRWKSVLRKSVILAEAQNLVH